MKPEKSSKSPISYADIARACNVSSMTVSRVMRKSSYGVKESTRQRVLAAAERLGYRPNPLVQTLMASVRRRHADHEANLAWISVRSPEKEYPQAVKEMREAARERANRLGFGLDLVSLTDSGMSAQKVDRMLRSRGVAGAIIEPLPNSAPKFEFPWELYPSATIGRSLDSPRIHHTMTYALHDIDHVLERLIQRGYQRIAFLQYSDAERRVDYAPGMFFEHYLKSIPPGRRIPPTVIDGWTTPDFSRWIQDNEPDAIISSAPDPINYLQEAGIAIPEQVGFATTCRKPAFPECAGIRLPFDEMGSGAVDLVIAQIHRNERGIPPRPKAIIVEGDWIEGSTLRQKVSA